MAKLRHMALSVADVPAAQNFLEDAFDMVKVGGSKSGAVYMSDGTINMALLNRKGKPLGWEGEGLFFGIDHFGMWVDDIEEACRKVEAAGAIHVAGNPSGDPNSFYEVKYREPQGTLFDLTDSGWAGAVKDVVPVGETEAAE